MIKLKLINSIINPNKPMTLDRRSFLTSSLALAGLSALAAPPKKSRVPLQLYSVRDDMKSNPLDTLKAVAQMGYKDVEPAAYLSDDIYVTRKIYGQSASELRKIIDGLGMKVPTSHVVLQKTHYNENTKDVSDQWKWVIEDAKTLGQDYIITPWFPWDKTNLDDTRKGLEVFNRVGEVCKKAGLRFGFHNHYQEFEQKFNGEYLYDIMLKELDLNYVCQQLDICNLIEAKVDPMTWLKKFPKHFEQLHVKDRNMAKGESTTLGDGGLDIKGILSYAKAHSPIKYWVIEQESYDGKQPLDCVKTDLERIKKYGFNV
jgi:sugar phosphate isomerase/epimerase